MTIFFKQKQEDWWQILAQGQSSSQKKKKEEKRTVIINPWFFYQDDNFSEGWRWKALRWSCSFAIFLGNYWVALRTYIHNSNPPRQARATAFQMKAFVYFSQPTYFILFYFFGEEDWPWANICCQSLSFFYEGCCHSMAWWAVLGPCLGSELANPRLQKKCTQTQPRHHQANPLVNQLLTQLKAWLQGSILGDRIWN